MAKLKATVLIVDDDPDILTTARVVLRQKFEEVMTEHKPQKLPALLGQHRFDVVLLDMNFSSGTTSGNEGLFWLQQLLGTDPDLQVVMMTAYGDIKLAVEAMKHGAADFIVKPWDNEKLVATVQAAYQHAVSKKELHHLKNIQTEYSRMMNGTEDEFIGTSPGIIKVMDIIEKVAPTDANILLLGENGTGKELIARRIHARSLRYNKSFVKVDVGSISASLFESELFGHKKGAFTDAREDRIGRIELANGGTLFVDEIGNVPSALQAKLLSVLQNREVIPLGSSKPVPIEVRLICATNIDIHRAAESGTFREDLLYRINTIEITLPPLRTRAEDIPMLVKHFVKMYCAKYRKEPKTLTNDSIQQLQKYHWPGNIRELQHAVERAVIMGDQPELTRNDFLLVSRKKEKETPEATSLDDLERRAILSTIEKYGGNMSRVAKELGVGRTTLYRKMAKYGIEIRNS